MKPTGTLTLHLACHCGACSADVRISAAATPTRCHCAACRRFAGADFATLLAVTPDAALASALAEANRAEHTCSSLGAVDRYFCRRCYSSLANVARDSVPRSITDQAMGSQTYVSLGCIDDSSVPPDVAERWSRRYEEWATAERPRWASATPWPTAELGGRFSRPPLPVDGRVATLVGRCACGGCVFQAVCGAEFQLQHCYCNLCRKMSGSVFQTWIPVRAALGTRASHVGPWDPPGPFRMCHST